MSGARASSSQHVTQLFTTLELNGGRNADNNPPDLLVRGGAVINKDLVAHGSIVSGGDVTMEGNLTVINETLLTNVHVLGDLSVDGTLFGGGLVNGVSSFATPAYWRVFIGGVEFHMPGFVAP